MADAAARPDTIAGRLGSIPGVVYLLIVLIAGFSFLDSSFASLSNIQNVAVQASVLMMLALPMTFIIMTEGLDLSMGAVLSLSSVVMAALLVDGHGLPAALAAAVGVGLAFGILNGALVVALAIPPFVATLGTLGIAQGVALVATDGQSVVGIGESLPQVYGSRLVGLPFPVFIAALSCAVFQGLLYRTRFGTYVFAIGGNRESLALAGVRANAYHMAVYALGGFMAGLAALLLTGRMNAGHPIAAIGMEFDAIAAVVIGGTSFERGNGWLPGTIVGVLAVGTLRNGLNVLAVSSSLQVASIGLLVIAAMLIDRVRR